MLDEEAKQSRQTLDILYCIGLLTNVLEKEEKEILIFFLSVMIQKHHVRGEIIP